MGASIFNISYEVYWISFPGSQLSNTLIAVHSVQEISPLQIHKGSNIFFLVFFLSPLFSVFTLDITNMHGVSTAEWNYNYDIGEVGASFLALNYIDDLDGIK